MSEIHEKRGKNQWPTEIEEPQNQKNYINTEGIEKKSKIRKQNITFKEHRRESTMEK